jgi:hypothetical protein
MAATAGCVEGVFQCSGGVAAQPGHVIERAWLQHALAMAYGFDAIQVHLGRLGRANPALCALEPRITDHAMDQPEAVRERPLRG